MKNVLRSPKGGIGERADEGEASEEAGSGRGQSEGELPRYHLTYEGDRLNIN